MIIGIVLYLELFTMKFIVLEYIRNMEKNRLNIPKYDNIFIYNIDFNNCVDHFIYDNIGNIDRYIKGSRFGIKIWKIIRT